MFGRKTESVLMIKTVSLETAKALKEAGFRQDTLFYFVKAKYDKEFHLSMFKTQEAFEENYIVYDGIGISSHSSVEIELAIESYPAPTTDELLEELPDFLDGSALLYWKKLWQGKTCYFAEISTLNARKESKFFSGDSLPEALAKMWLHLKKEGLLNDKYSQPRNSS